MSHWKKEWKRFTRKRGKPIPIVLAHKDNTFTLNEEAVNKYLIRDELKDHNVFAISVAGAYRHGKSFLLNFFLRYLEAQYVFNEKEWMDDEEEPLTGFHWSGGSDRITTGILMWSEVFTTKIDGENVAIILLDTQGTFDKSPIKQCAVMFSFATLISSVQIFNLMNNIKENDLQYLEAFTEYGRLVLKENSRVKPFQKLQFLVRDWQWPDEHSFGKFGGNQKLNDYLKVKDDQHKELKELRTNIRSYFTEISCFLMPHPGSSVATSATFDGNLKDIDSEFKKYLKILVPMILAPKNIILKKVNGTNIKVHDFAQCLKIYLNIYNRNDLPEPKSMFEATAEVNNLAALDEAKTMYIHEMEKCLKFSALKDEKLQDEHEKIRKMVLMFFKLKKKLGGEEFSKPYKKKLIQFMTGQYDKFVIINEEKRDIVKKFKKKIILTCVKTAGKVAFMFGAVGAGLTAIGGATYYAATAIARAFVFW